MSNKVYVDVLAEFSKDGLLIPKEITWEDGRKYEITRVKDKRRAASTRAGGVGERYTCVVDEQIDNCPKKGHKKIPPNLKTNSEGNLGYNKITHPNIVFFIW